LKAKYRLSDEFGKVGGGLRPGLSGSGYALQTTRSNVKHRKPVTIVRFPVSAAQRLFPNPFLIL
jgi:hypothetical protein